MIVWFFLVACFGTETEETNFENFMLFFQNFQIPESINFHTIDWTLT